MVEGARNKVATTVLFLCHHLLLSRVECSGGGPIRLLRTPLSSGGSRESFVCVGIITSLPLKGKLVRKKFPLLFILAFIAAVTDCITFHSWCPFSIAVQERHCEQLTLQKVFCLGEGQNRLLGKAARILGVSGTWLQSKSCLTAVVLENQQDERKYNENHYIINLCIL